MTVQRPSGRNTSLQAIFARFASLIVLETEPMSEPSSLKGIRASLEGDILLLAPVDDLVQGGQTS